MIVKFTYDLFYITKNPGFLGSLYLNANSLPTSNF